MKKQFLVIVLATACLAGAFANGSPDAAPVQAIEATFAHIFQPGHTITKMADSFAQKVSEATKGRVLIKVVPAGALGGMDSNIEALKLGSVQITVGGESYTSRYYAPMGVTTAPYAFQSWDHFRRYVDSKLFDQFKGEYTKVTGNVIVGTFTSGFRSVTANKPVRTPADMVGLKIRVPDAPAFTAMPRAAGASPTPIAFAEVYLALQQKVVDAQENPLETIFNMKFHEVTKYICLTEHMMEPAHIIVSSGFWAKVSAADKARILAIGREVALAATESAQKAATDLVATFEKAGNIVITDVDKKAFADICVEFNTSSQRGWTPDQFRQLQELATK